MAAADEILGISGQMDISDIQKSFDILLGDLEKLGTKTDSLSARMTKALNDIAQSSDTSSKSTQQSFKELNAIIVEAQEKLTATPKKIQDVSLELANASKTLETLKEKLSKATAGTSEWETVNKMLENQGRTVERLKAQYTTLTDSFSDAQAAANVLNTAMDAINAARSISNTATGVNAGLHVGVAAAVGSESVAHGVNAEKIGTETQAVKDNTQAYQKATEANQQRTETANAEAAALDKLTERILQGKASENEYIRAKENAQERYKQLMNEQTELLEKEKAAREEANTFKVVDGNFVGNNNEINAHAADALLERANKLKNEANEIASSLQRLSEAYTATTQKAEAEQKRETESTNKTLDAIRAKEDELKKLNEQLEQMQAHHANGWGGDFFASMRKGDNPFATIKDYFAEGDAIKEKQQQIAEVTAQLEKLRTATEETKTASTDMWSGMSKNDIATVIQEDINQLKILKSEYSEIAQIYGKDSDKAKENKQKQEEITREIVQGKDKLREMGTSYEDVSKAAKKAAKSTKEIGDKAKESTGKIKGMIDKLKSFLTKGLSLDGILGMVFSSKGAALASITAVAGGMKWLSQQAESLRVAMIPIKTYLDEGTLEELRQQFVALEYQSSHSAEEMAAAGTRWAKYFEGLRGNASAIAEVTKTSNDFATVLGTTSEKAADYQLKIAGAYHQTALEAQDNSTIIINASKRSTAKYEELAQALASTANRAQNAGISFKELAAATAYGTSTFGSASEAAYSYIMMMQSLSRQSKSEFNPAVVGATKALENLHKSGKMNATLTSLIHGRNASLAKVFVQNAAAIAKMKDGLDNEASAAATVAGAEGKVENVEKRLQNAKKALAHEVNANLTPAYADFIRFCAYLIKEIGSVSTAIKNTINPVVNSIGKAIDWLDKKLSGSIISKILSTFGKSNPLTFSTVLAIDAFKGMKSDEKKQQHEDKLKQIYEEELKKVGNQSPGKAFLAAAKRISHNGKVSNEDKKYLNKLMNMTRALNNAKTTGEGLSIGKDNIISNKSGQNRLKQLRDQQRKYREEEAEREAKELANIEKIKWDLYVAEQENGIVKMKNVNEKENAQRKLNYEKSKHEIEEERKTLLQQNIQTAKALYEKNPNNKGKEGFYASGLDKNVKLTTEQAQLIQTKLDTLNAEYEEDNKKRLQEEISKWNAFVEKYGSIQQRIYAITEEYKRKIKDLRDSGNEIGASAAENELQDKLSDLQMQQAKDAIDWDSVFQDLESHSSEYLEKLRTQLKKLLSSGTLKIDDMKVVSEQITKVDEAISKQKDSWGIVNEYVREHKRLIEEAENAQLALNQAQSEQAKTGLANTSKKLDIQAMLATAGIDASYSSITYANKDKYISKVTDPKTQSNLKKAFDELGVTEIKLAKSTEEVTKAQKKANAANDKAKDSAKKTALKIVGDLQGVLDKVQDLPNLLSSIGLGNSGFAKSVGNGINAVSNAKNAAADFASGNYIGAALNSVNAIKSFGKIFGIGGGNGAEVAKKTQELTESNQRLQYSIEQLKSSIDKTSGMSAVSNYQKAYDAQKQINKQSMEILQSQMGYHGSHHSNAYYWNLSAQDYAAINRTLAQQSAVRGGYVNSTINKVNSLEDIYKLTPEQMKDIRTYNQDVWKNMTDQGKYDKTEYWENYTDLAEKLEELTDKINQNLTQTTFDSLKDNFISNLMDMSKSAQDFANDFTTMLNKSMLNFAVDDLANKRLKALYEKWADKMKQGQLSDNDLNALKKEYDNIVNEGLKIRDNIAAITGYKEVQSQQTATGKGIEAITADQASSLIGIGHAVQMAQEQGNEVRKAIAVDISFLRIYAEQTYNNISEMRDIQYQGLQQLEAINKNTAPIILIREDIASMYKLMKDKY